MSGDEEYLAALGRDNDDDTPAATSAPRCGVPGCAETAVVVADPDGAELPACQAHMQDMADASGGRIVAVRLA